METTSDNRSKVNTVALDSQGNGSSGSSGSSPSTTPLALPTLTDLLTTMKTGPSTNGWDVVCSYTEDALNKLLAANYQAGSATASTTVPGSNPYTDPFTNASGTINWSVTLGTPSFTFLDTQGEWCQLTMPITGGSYTITPTGGTASSPTTIPGSTYSIVATLPLAALRGDEQITTSGTVVTFEQGAADTAHVVIHFKATDAGVSWVLQPDAPEGSVLSQYVLPGVMDYFRTQVNEIDYALAGVTSNSSGSNPGSGSGGDGDTVTLVPNSFVFAAAGGVLSLYIQTTNSGNPVGNAVPSFQPGGTEIIPVPEGYTASLIFSRSLIENVYVGSALENIGTYSFDDTVATGIALKLAYGNTSLDWDPGFREPGQELDSEHVLIDFSNLPFSIVLQDQQATIKWSFEQDIKWTYWTFDPTGGSTEQQGTTHLTIDLDKTVAIGSVTNNSLSIDFSLASADYSLQMSSSNDGWGSFESDFESGVTSHFQTSAPLPGLKIDLGSLNFFATTNLLLPGQTVIKIDTTAGLSVPRDSIVLGQVGSS